MARSIWLASAGGMLIASGLYFKQPSTFMAGVFLAMAGLT